MPAAIEVLALDAARLGETTKAEQLFGLSDRISRRSLATRLWFIQRSVDEGDVHAALHNIDLALRTSSVAPRILFPVLTRGITDPALVPPVAALLGRPSDWRTMFLEYAASNADPTATGSLLLLLRDQTALIRSQTDVRVINRLVAAEQFELASRVDAKFNGSGGSKPKLAEGDFRSGTARPPFGWSLVDEPEISAFRSMPAGKPVLAYNASAERGGQVAAQLLMLPPGNYRLTAQTADAGDDQDPPFWAISCAGKGGERIAIMNQPPKGGASALTRFTVPPACKAQWLTLNLRASTRAMGQSGAISWVQIEEQRPAP